MDSASAEVVAIRLLVPALKRQVCSGVTLAPDDYRNVTAIVVEMGLHICGCRQTGRREDELLGFKLEVGMPAQEAAQDIAVLGIQDTAGTVTYPARGLEHRRDFTQQSALPR